MVLGRDHSVGASAVGHTQASPQVVRIGDTVEHQQQRRFTAGLQLVQQIIQRCGLLDRLHPRGHTLMTMTARQLGDAQTVGFDQANTRLARAVKKLPHALVAP